MFSLGLIFSHIFLFPDPFFFHIQYLTNIILSCGEQEIKREINRFPSNSSIGIISIKDY